MSGTNTIRKQFRLSMSKKFPDGSLVTITLGTEMEETTDDAKALFDKVRGSVKDDLKLEIDNDKLSRSVVKSIARQMDLEERVEKARVE